MAELGDKSSLSHLNQQLSLEVRLRDDATFSNYLAQESVLPLLDMLQSRAGAEEESMIYLCGGSGTGKSHLLQACCHEQAGSALYLPLKELSSHAPKEVLRGLETLDRVCIDDIQAIAGNRDWEVALFGLVNLARESGCRLVFAAPAAPRALGVKLADLESRLGWAVVFQLPRLADEDKVAILQFRAERRGLSLSVGTAEYIVSRAPRGMDELLAVLEHLDKASLTHQRALSIPFVKEALGW